MQRVTQIIHCAILSSLCSCGSLKEWKQYNVNDLRALHYRDLKSNNGIKIVEVDPSKLRSLPLLSDQPRNRSFLPFSRSSSSSTRSAKYESYGTPNINIPEEELDLSLLKEALTAPALEDPPQ